MTKIDLRYQAKEEVFIEVGRAKYLKNSELWRRIMVHKWEQSNDAGYNIELVPAIISYFIDNPSLIPPIPGNPEEAENIKCMHVSDIQRELLPLAIKRNRYYRSYESEYDIGERKSETDFFMNRAKEWALKARTAICAVYCSESGRCKKAHESYESLQGIISKEELSC